MLGGEHEERRSPQGVGTGREHADLLPPLAAERDRGPLGAADPVLLHLLHVVGPRQVRQIREQPVRVGRDPKEPLVEFPLLGRGPAPLARPTHHLFVGEHGLAVRAVVHRGPLLVGEAVLIKLQEQPLRPAVVVGEAGRDLALPVVLDPPRPELVLGVGDVGERPVPRVDPPLDGSVLRREAERVPPHRVEDVVAAHEEEPHDRVADDVVPAMADVEVPGRVGEHVQVVELPLRVGGVDPEVAPLPPEIPPLFLDRVRIVGFVVHRSPPLASRSASPKTSCTAAGESISQ